ncbi:DUF3500 domain-containing protein [Microbacterium sp. NPDC058389]|uniref:DUF3500 domain-containing protein n=1 Tax=Microbacterium sp. NPDC058389 TaxID=3346475 RepID=UPI003657F047
MSHQSDRNDIDGFFSNDRTSGRAGAIELAGDSFRDHLYDLDDPIVAASRGMTYERFTADRKNAPFLRDLLEQWDALFAEDFVGVTVDGMPQPGLYRLPPSTAGEADASLVEVAERALATLWDDQLAAILRPMDSPDWRGWSNPEFVFHRNGVRLEDVNEAQAEALLDIVRSSLSPRGWEMVDEAMGLNGFLGDLVGLPQVMNDRSYWFTVFGAPSTAEPWGWQLYGHHVALNFVTVAGRHVIAPVFLGGEPAVTDGRAPLFATREALAIDLASSFTPAQRAAAVVYDSVLDPAMPPDRVHPADERHVAGAFRDNRVVPYEGISAVALDDGQQATLRRLVADVLVLYRDDQRAVALAEFDAHLEHTHVSWYGATDGSTPFYLRIHSPVILAELDHHAGVWLSNRLPARFHVHTTLRAPNGNDYGKALIAQWNDRRAGE